MFKPSDEWIKQAKYDLETAGAMFETGRYIYTVFMCHLSVEKLLKGLYAVRLGKNPPKSHDLSYFAESLGLNPTKQYQYFLEFLNDISVPTRYPDELTSLLKEYTKKKTQGVLEDTKGIFKWLRKQF